MSDPARPCAGHTEDGRPLQVVTSYARRGSRLNTPQQRAWDAARRPVGAPRRRRRRRDLGPAPLVRPGGARWWWRSGPATASRWQPSPPRGPSRTSWRWRCGGPASPQPCAGWPAADVPNVRAGHAGRPWLLEHRLAAGLVERGRGPSSPTPGPRSGTTSAGWSDLASPRLVASRLRPGGLWRLATDWPDYADHVEETLASVRRARGRARRAVGRAAGDPLRATRARRRPAARRPHLPRGSER